MLAAQAEPRRNRTNQRKDKISMLLGALQESCVEFCVNTGIHGLKYVAENKRRRVERLVWVAVVVAGLVCAGFMASTFLRRYSSRPTRASVETSHYPTRLLPFPAVTVCNANVASRSKARAVLRHLSLPPGVNRSEAHKLVRLLGELIQPQAHRSHDYAAEDLDVFQGIIEKNNKTARGLMLEMGQSCSEMLERCKWEGELRNCSELFQVRKTYRGYCCSFNYRGVTEDSRKGNKGLVRHNINVTRTLYYSHRMGLAVLLNPSVDDYMLSSLFSEAARALVHGPDDYPDDTATEVLLPAGRELLLRVSATSRYCSDQVRVVQPLVRNCVFPGEVRLATFPDYSPVNCITECRTQHAVNLCGCLPAFYHHSGEHRICNLRDIPCLNKYHALLRTGTQQPTPTTERDAGYSPGIQCDCPDLCNDVQYDVQSSSGDFKASHFQHSPFFSGANVTGRTLFYIYFGDHVSVRTRTDLVNNWNDLLSSLGGIFSLFLGCSLMSAVELLYFFTLRLYLRARSSMATLRMRATPPRAPSPCHRRRRRPRVGLATPLFLRIDARLATTSAKGN